MESAGAGVRPGTVAEPRKAGLVGGPLEGPVELQPLDLCVISRGHLRVFRQEVGFILVTTAGRQWLAINVALITCLSPHVPRPSEAPRFLSIRRRVTSKPLGPAPRASGPQCPLALRKIHAVCLTPPPHRATCLHPPVILALLLGGDGQLALGFLGQSDH